MSVPAAAATLVAKPLKETGAFAEHGDAVDSHSIFRGRAGYTLAAVVVTFLFYTAMLQNGVVVSFTAAFQTSQSTAPPLDASKGGQEYHGAVVSAPRAASQASLDQSAKHAWWPAGVEWSGPAPWDDARFFREETRANNTVILADALHRAWMHRKFYRSSIGALLASRVELLEEYMLFAYVTRAHLVSLAAVAVTLLLRHCYCRIVQEAICCLRM
jgi:hypothetical protein